MCVYIIHTYTLEMLFYCLKTYIVLNKRSNYFPSSMTAIKIFSLVWLICPGVILLRILESVVLCPSLFMSFSSSAPFFLFFLGFQLLVCKQLLHTMFSFYFIPFSPFCVSVHIICIDLSLGSLFPQLCLINWWVCWRKFYHWFFLVLHFHFTISYRFHLPV